VLQKHHVIFLFAICNAIPLCQNRDIDSIIIMIIKYLYAAYIILPDFRSVVMH